MTHIKIEIIRGYKRKVSVLWVNGDHITDYDFDVDQAIHVIKKLKKIYGIDIRKQVLEE